MKTQKWILGLMLLLGGGYVSADITLEPAKVAMKLNRAYVPVGFDSNDLAQFAIEGELPNSCYRVGPHAFEVDKLNKRILVTQTAYVHFGFCLQMIIPFTQYVNVGMVPAGSYTLVDNTSGTELGKLEITQAANPGPDDFLYAPITDAYINVDALPQKNMLVLNGTFPDRCTELAEVKVHEYKDVIVVQPISRRTEGNADCSPEKTRFTKTVQLSSNLHGLYLLHVRSLNGAAVNRMVDFP